MAQGFSFLFWGLIVVLVNIELRGFDILPDFIGYALIGIGGAKLAEYDPAFQVTRNLAWPLACLALISYVVPVNLANASIVVIAALSLVLIWFLLGGVIRFTRERERPDLAEHAVRYRRIFIAVALVALLFQQLARIHPETAAGMATLTTVAMLVALAFILHLIYVVRQELAVNSLTT